MKNYQATIISQYSNAATINALIKDFNTWIDPSSNIDAFYNMMMNLDTAQGYGLDCWGRIVGVQRVLQISTVSFFGYEEALPGSYPYNSAPFYTGEPTTSNYSLSDDAFRTLIIAKALANITDGSIKSINKILLTLFPGRGNCYVIDNENMTMTYKFEFQLQPYEISIVETSGVLPRSTGVQSNVVIEAPATYSPAPWDEFYWDANCWG
jgi:hypothetical protein